MSGFQQGSLNSPAARVRSTSLQDLLEQLRQAANPLPGANTSGSSFQPFMDPTLASSAAGARAGNLRTTGAAKFGAAADATTRLGAIDELETQFPGRKPGGTGLTGNLGIQDHLNMLGDQFEQTDLRAALAGQSAPTTQVDLGSLADETGTGQRRQAARRAAPIAQEAGSGTGSNQDIEGRKTLLGVRQLEAETQQAETEAALADPLTKAKSDASVRRFGARTGVTPETGADEFPVPGGGATIPGITRISDRGAGQTNLQQAADRYTDPNFPIALKGREAELDAGYGSSPGERIARTNARARGISDQSRETVAGIRATVEFEVNQARQQGMGERQLNDLSMRRTDQLLRARIELLKNSVATSRYGTGMMGGVDPGIENEIDELNQFMQQLQGMGLGAAGGGGGAGGAGAAGGDVTGLDPSQVTGEAPGTRFEMDDGSIWVVDPSGRLVPEG